MALKNYKSQKSETEVIIVWNVRFSWSSVTLLIWTSKIKNMLPGFRCNVSGFQKNMVNVVFLWISGTMERMKVVWFIVSAYHTCGYQFKVCSFWKDMFNHKSHTTLSASVSYTLRATINIRALQAPIRSIIEVWPSMGFLLPMDLLRFYQL